MVKNRKKDSNKKTVGKRAKIFAAYLFHIFEGRIASKNAAQTGSFCPFEVVSPYPLLADSPCIEGLPFAGNMYFSAGVRRIVVPQHKVQEECHIHSDGGESTRGDERYQAKLLVPRNPLDISHFPWCVIFAPE